MTAAGDLVVDASALVLAIADRVSGGDQARHQLFDRARHAPRLIDAEIGNVLRKHVLRGTIGCPLLTGDHRLAHGAPTDVEVIVV